MVKIEMSRNHRVVVSLDDVKDTLILLSIGLGVHHNIVSGVGGDADDDESEEVKAESKATN